MERKWKREKEDDKGRMKNRETEEEVNVVLRNYGESQMLAAELR